MNKLIGLAQYTGKLKSAQYLLYCLGMQLLLFIYPGFLGPGDRMSLWLAIVTVLALVTLTPGFIVSQVAGSGLGHMRLAELFARGIAGWNSLQRNGRNFRGCGQWSDSVRGLCWQPALFHPMNTLGLNR